MSKSEEVLQVTAQESEIFDDVEDIYEPDYEYDVGYELEKELDFNEA